MNQFTFDPHKMQSVGAAQHVIGLYNQEIALNVAQKIPLEEALAATTDAILKANPQMKVDNLQLIADQANLVGHNEGNRQNLDATLDAFIRALPFAIRKQIQAAS